MTNSGVSPGAGGVPGGYEVAPEAEMAAFDTLPECLRRRLWDFPVKPNCAVMARNYRMARLRGTRDEKVLAIVDAEMRTYLPKLTLAAYGPGHPAS
jgi:hypothetical protein